MSFNLGVQDMTACPSCGKENAADARFCFSCGTSLLQAPPVKVDVRAPLTPYPGAPITPMAPAPVAPPIYSPRPMTRPGSCYYHPELPSSFVCSRCGRSICVGCTRPYGMLTFCPECFWGLAPRFSYPTSQYQQQQTQGGLF